MVAAFAAETHGGIDVSVTPNASVTGAISGVVRQVDVLLDARWGDDDITSRIIVDAKHRADKVDIKDVEEFEGMMRDCRAHRGILVCTSGFTSGAKRRALDNVGTSILTIDEAEELSWESYFEPCIGRCAREPSARKRSGMVLWDGQLPLMVGGGWAIVWTGKCDQCHNFHIWCWDCGAKFSLPDESEERCDCDRLWVTPGEDVTDPSGDHLAAIHLILYADDQVIPIDRKRMF